MRMRLAIVITTQCAGKREPASKIVRQAWSAAVLPKWCTDDLHGGPAILVILEILVTKMTKLTGPPPPPQVVQVVGESDQH